MSRQKKLDETEQIFSEYFDAREKANAVKENSALPPQALSIEYARLLDNYEKLLKLAVRISRLGDKAQNKLMKYKEVFDTMRED